MEFTNHLTMCDASSSLPTTQPNGVPSQGKHVGPTESGYVRMTIRCDQENPGGFKEEVQTRTHSVPASRVYVMAYCHENVHLRRHTSRSIVLR